MNANSTKFSSEQIKTLKSLYGSVTKVDPCTPIFAKLEKFVGTLTPEQKQQILDESVPWLTTIIRGQQRRATA